MLHDKTKSWWVENVQPRAQVPRSRSVPDLLARGIAQEGEKAAIRVNQVDAHNLGRFLEAQQRDYDRALAEIRSGRKRTHWMWYIFPQFAGLGVSPVAQHFAIRSLAEAKAYITHPILGARLIECAEAALNIDGRSATDIFGTPDDLKLRSCATLFDLVLPGSIFERLLAKYYDGVGDPLTIDFVRDRADVR